MICGCNTHVSKAANRQFDYISSRESGGCVGHTNDQDDGETLSCR